MLFGSLQWNFSGKFKNSNGFDMPLNASCCCVRKSNHLKLLATHPGGLFRALSNICEETFYKIGKQLLIVSYFRKTFSHGFLTVS